MKNKITYNQASLYITTDDIFYISLQFFFHYFKTIGPKLYIICITSCYLNI